MRLIKIMISFKNKSHLVVSTKKCNQGTWVKVKIFLSAIVPDMWFAYLHLIMGGGGGGGGRERERERERERYF